MNDCILIVDIETTGFTVNDYIVEIGIVSLNIKTGEIIPLVDECVWERGISKEEIEKSWIFNNSDINVTAIQLGNNLQKIRNLIQTIINHYPLGITAYNNAFDFRFLDHRGFKLNKLLCPMQILTPIMKLEKANFKGGYKFPSVIEAYHYFFPDEKYIEKHRGLDDAIHEAKIIYELIKLNEFKI
jgi:DNA polymerase-3 subunit epsilon